MNNPLYARWREVHTIDGYAQFSPSILDRRFNADLMIRSLEARGEMIAEYSFAVPSNGNIKRLAELSPLVEIGAGRGYWAQLIREAGGDIIATDDGSWFPCAWWPDNMPNIVRRMDAVLAAETYAHRTLLIIWPPMTTMAEDALKVYERYGGKRVVYIGEGTSGCTGSDVFHRMLGEGCACEWHLEEGKTCTCPAPTWHQTEEFTIPQWEGLHDYGRIYEPTSVVQ